MLCAGASWLTRSALALVVLPVHRTARCLAVPVRHYVPPQGLLLGASGLRTPYVLLTHSNQLHQSVASTLEALINVVATVICSTLDSEPSRARSQVFLRLPARIDYNLTTSPRRITSTSWPVIPWPADPEALRRGTHPIRVSTPCPWTFQAARRARGAF